jgi:hypothetical protein
MLLRLEAYYMVGENIDADQPPGAGAGVGPRFRQGSELRLRVHDALDDAEQVEGAARQPVDARDRHHVAGGQLAEHAVKLAPVAFSR